LMKVWDFCSAFRISSTSFTICAFQLGRFMSFLKQLILADLS
jgi:hypothetical protein